MSPIEAELTYLAAGSATPFAYAYAPPPGMPQRQGRYEARRVAIGDARALPAPSLDREGFALRRRPSAVRDFYDDAEVVAVYYPEVEALIRAATGADRVVIFDHTRRNTAPEQQSPGRAKEAADIVHNDYTDRSAPKRVRELLPPAEAEARLARRYLEINVWRPISGPVEAWPLALCDAQSLDRRDLVPAERRYPDRVGETYVVTYSPRHRWLFFPRMVRDEALLIKCFDSATDGRARLAVHTAFADPTTPAAAPPRESIEVRAFAFFAD
jgi:hypothetical protein